MAARFRHGAPRAADAFTNDNRRHVSPEQAKVIQKAKQKVARELKAEGKTQQDIGKLMGVAHNTVSVWLGGNNVNVDNPSVPDCRLKIPVAERPKIYAAVTAGAPVAKVAADYKVSKAISECRVVAQRDHRRRDPAPNLPVRWLPWPLLASAKARKRLDS
jgi:predicted transcriptional regulator